MSESTPPTEMRIGDLLQAAERPLLSYEFFPPKSEVGMASLRDAVEGLAHTQPDFVTVTYGAGGSTRTLTLDVAELLRRFRYRPVMPHLTCVGSSRSELCEIADQLWDNGFRNIMTLRGDPPKGESSFTPPADGLSCARELVTLLKERHPDFSLGVAGYPEGHPEAADAAVEMDYLKSKVDAGADFITTQLFLENSLYYRFVDRCRAAGITVPILPGLMPTMSLAQIRRITTMCGAKLPPELEKRLENAGDSSERALSVGILWCTEQIVDLLQNGVPGVHLYILNQIRPAMAYQLATTFMEMTR